MVYTPVMVTGLRAVRIAAAAEKSSAAMAKTNFFIFNDFCLIEFIFNLY